MGWLSWLPAKLTCGDLEAIRMDITKLKADLAALVAKEAAAEGKEKADLAQISQTIADLKAKVGAGETVTQADIDALDGQVQQVSSGLDTIVSDLDKAAAPETAPVA